MKFLAQYLLPFFASTTVAFSQIYTFDDIAPTVVTESGFRYAPIPNGYGGLQWQNFDAQDTRYGPWHVTGYSVGTISPNNVAFNADGAPATLSGPSFDLISGYFTGAWNDGLQLQVTAFSAGRIAYGGVYTLSATTPTLITFNFHAVDYVYFASSGGTSHGYGGGGTHFVMDNLVVVPESNLLGIGIIGFVSARLLLRRCQF